jgi:hypothetical protein
MMTEKEQTRKIESDLGDENRLISKDGQIITDLVAYQRNLETEEHTQDVGTVRKEQIHDLVETKRDKRGQKKLGINRGDKTFEAMRRNRKESLSQSSYVRHLTERDMFMEKQEELRAINLEKYGKLIIDQIVRLVNEYISLKPSEMKQNFKKYQPMECAIIALTMGPVNLKGLTKRLDSIIGSIIDPKKFQFETSVRLDSIYRRILNGKGWLTKYLQLIEKNGSLISSTYQFPPQLMKIAAEDPHKLWIGMSGALPKDTKPFTEDELLTMFPELKDASPYINGEAKSTGSVPSESKYISSLFDEEDYKKRVHVCESDRWTRLKELKQSWLTITDIKKKEFMVGLMQINPIIDMAPVWSKIGLDFLNKHENSNSSFEQFTPGNINGLVRDYFLNKDCPISRVIISRRKTALITEFGLMPDASKIPWLTLCKLLLTDERGWDCLEDLKKKNPNIIAYEFREREKPKEEVDPSDVETTDEESSVSDKPTQSDGERIGIPSPVMNIVNAITSNVDDNQLATIVRQALPELIQLTLSVFTDVVKTPSRIDISLHFGEK